MRLRLPTLLVCCLLAASAAYAQRLDVVLATVNGEEITPRQVVARLVEYRGEDSLDKMINRVLLKQEAARLKVTVADAEVNQRLSDIQNRFKNEDDYRGFLAQSRLTEKQLSDEIRNTLLAQKVALKANPIKDDDLQEYDASIIFAADKATAEQWIKELDNGGSFRDIASLKSIDPTLRAAAGRLKPFLGIEMSDVAKAIEDQKLLPGRYTRTPVQIGPRWAIIRLEQRIPATTASASHKERLNAAVTASRVDQWVSETREKAKDKIRKNPLDQPVVATVAGESITHDQLVKRLLEYHGDETLQLMVNRALLLQAAKTAGVTVSEAEVDERVKQAKKGFTDEVAFQAFLNRSNLTERQYRDENRFEVMQEKVALKESPVVDADLQQYEVRMILAPARKQAEAWIKELDKGTDFGKFAAENSLDPQGRQTGGRLRPFIKVELLDIWRAITDEKLKPGEYTKSPVLLTDNSWVILKLDAVNPPPKAGPDRDKLAAVVTRYRVDQWLNTARQKAKVAFPTTLAAVIGAEKPAN